MSYAGKRSNVDCLAGALGMNGWLDEHNVACHRAGGFAPAGRDKGVFSVYGNAMRGHVRLGAKDARKCGSALLAGPR